MLSNSSIGDFETFLSPPVRCLLVDSKETDLTSACHNFVTSHLTFNWNSISSHLKYDEGITTEKYLTICPKMWPIFIECGKRLMDYEEMPEHFLRWTNCTSDIILCFSELKTCTDCIAPLKTCLLLSSIFEHSVGNVYHLEGKTVPFLLRDLLSSQQLNAVFGNVPMLVAKALLGTPLAFNIRNICWHGFPAPEEIHAEIAATLIVLITSFGEIIQNGHITSFPSRPKMGMDAWVSFQIPLESVQFPQIKDHSSEVRKFLEECDFIPSTHLLYWTSALHFLLSARYGECLVLLLPALEHILRCAFCAINGCPHRVLVAEQQVLYTTMDEMLDQYYTKSEGTVEENGLPCGLGRPLMEMLMDMFSSFGGPRIRDKLSHGECDLGQIPLLATNHLFCISLLVLLKLGASSEFKLATHLQNVEKNYSAKFHSTSILRNQATVIMEKLKEFDVHIKSQEAVTYLIDPEVLNLQLSLLVYSSKFRKFCNNDIYNHIYCYLSEPVATLHRSKLDLSIIALLRKIISALELACDNSLATLEIRQHGLNQRVLRSRNRISHLRMLEFIPSFQVIVRSVILITLIQILDLPHLTINLKFIKTVLQFAENISSLSSFDKNRWVEIKVKTADFCQQCNHFLDLSGQCAKEEPE